MIAPTPTGFGAADARLYVTDVHFTPDRLIISGERTFPVYDDSEKEFHLTLLGEKVNIRIALPTANGNANFTPDLLKAVFLTTSELANNCSPEEQARFQEAVSVANERQQKKRNKKGDVPKKDEPPPVQSLAEVTSYCFPTGEKAHKVERGVYPPKILSDADPEYSEAARHKRIQGTVVLLVVVDQQGRPTTLYVIRSLGHGLDEPALRAVQRWTFQPGTFQGTTVAVAINVAVNFKLY